MNNIFQDVQQFAQETGVNREVKDYSVLLMYVLNVLLNGTIWIQCLILPKKRKEGSD